MKKFLILILILMLFFACNNSQLNSNYQSKEYKINGIAFFKNPLKNQRIDIYKDGNFIKSIYTDNNGYFSTKLLSNGIYVLKTEVNSEVLKTPFKVYDNEFISLTPLSSMLYNLSQNYSLEDSLFYLGYIFGLNVLNSDANMNDNYKNIIYSIDVVSKKDGISFEDGVYNLQKEVKNRVFGDNYEDFISDLKDRLKSIGINSKYINSTDTILSLDDIDKNIIDNKKEYLLSFLNQLKSKFRHNLDYYINDFYENYAYDIFNSFYNINIKNYFIGNIIFDAINNINEKKVIVNDKEYNITLNKINSSDFYYKIKHNNEYYEGNLTKKGNNYILNGELFGDINSSIKIIDNNLTLLISQLKYKYVKIENEKILYSFKNNDILYQKILSVKFYYNSEKLSFYTYLTFKDYSSNIDNQGVFKNEVFYNNGVYPSKVIFKGNIKIDYFDNWFNNVYLVFYIFDNSVFAKNPSKEFSIYGYSTYNDNLNYFFLDKNRVNISLFDYNYVYNLDFYNNTFYLNSTHIYNLKAPIDIKGVNFNNQKAYFNYNFLGSLKDKNGLSF